MISYEQFKAQTIDEPVDVDRAYGNQCWDLVAYYDQLVIGIPRSAGYGLPTGPDLAAKDCWYYFKDPLPQFFVKMPATMAVQGDVMVWGEAIGKDGHIAIFDHATPGGFVSLDQNWPIGSYVHLQQHNYNGVLGALHPIGVIMNDNIKIVGAPAMVSWAKDRIDIFARGSDDGLWHLYFNEKGWSTWEKLGGGIATSPAVSSWEEGRLDVTATGVAGDLMHFWFDENGWQGPESLGIPIGHI